MKILGKVLGFLLLPLAFGACTKADNGACTKADTLQSQQVVEVESLSEFSKSIDNPDLFPFSAEQAFEKARAFLGQNGSSRSDFAVCDAGIFFRVIFIPTLQEVSVSREDGRMLTLRSLTDSRVEDEMTPCVRESSIGPKDAIEIGRKYFIEYGKRELGSDEKILDDYFPTACDIGKSWRVSFIPNAFLKVKSRGDFAKLPYVSAPDFVVDKHCGRITYFNYTDRNWTLIDSEN